MAPPPSHFRFWCAIVCGALGASVGVARAESPAAARFHREIEPLLTEYCYDCHGDGKRKGKVAFDEFTSEADLLGKTQLWFAALKNVRAGLMPPRNPEVDLRPSAAEIQRLETWIKSDAFGIDPTNPDPGRVTVRRLNRVEYRNTIRDLMGVNFESEVEFPPDDTGHGFDNLGEVLTVSPLLLEKYLQAAEEIVDKAVPRVARTPAKRVASARDFRRDDRSDRAGAAEESNADDASPADREARRRDLNARHGGRTAHTFSIPEAGDYKLAFEANIRSTFDFDTSRALLLISVDGVELKRQEIAWGSKPVRCENEFHWAQGPHQVTVEVQPILPLVPNPPDPEPPPSLPPGFPRPPVERSVDVRISSAELLGPMEEKSWVPPENYRRFFPEDPPTSLQERDASAQKILRNFATRAFRRPVTEAKVDQLVAIAHAVYTVPGKRFEDGIARAMMGVLASPRFLFRIEEPAPDDLASRFAAVDEYALASRLSYFLWSSMPDDDLFRLAGRGELRRELPAQVARMLKDPKSQAFVKNFPGQWLQARDIETVPINARAVLGLGDVRGNRALRADFSGPLRKAMRAETEMVFDHVLREDRSVLEFIDSDYTFLNARLAKHYGIPGVEGDSLRRVTLPADSPRGGFLTQGTVLAVTSNPTRTSPVKRGLFVLENILGTPTPPPPPNIPALEESQKAADGHELPLREALARHRSDKLCSSCHARMDPLGFALENFNAMGNWRDLDAKRPIDSSGQLVTGEAFTGIRELKHILTHERRLDYYRCLTEKMLTYALGRGLEYYDVQAVDEIVARLERENGRFSALLGGIIASAPFQKLRNPAADTAKLTLLSP